MWFFEDENDMVVYVLKGLSIIGGDMLFRVLTRLLNESEGQHRVLALENALRHSLDKAGHIFMEHLGREKAKEGAQPSIPLQRDLNHLSISNCPLLRFYHEESFEPTQSYVCSMCKGYMQVQGESLGMRKLLKVSLLQNETCVFSFGGE